MDKLPPELVHQIVDIVRGPPRPLKHGQYCSCRQCRRPRPKLTPYTTLSRTWQAVIERIIWKDLNLNRSDCLIQLKEYTSPSDSDSSHPHYRRDRVRYIRSLTWPCYGRGAHDSESEELPGWYNKAFHASLVELFDLLQSWNSIRPQTEMRLSLWLGSGAFISRSHLPDEIRPSPAELATLSAIQLWHGVRMRHQVHLSASAVQDLPIIPYITAFGFDNADDAGVAPSVFLGLMSRFPNVKRVYGGEGAGVPMGASKALADQRQVFVDYLHYIPSSVEVFKYKIDYKREMSFNPAHNAANYLSRQGLDELSIGLRTLSMRLCRLKLKYVRISGALFWPGEAEAVDTAGLYWPRLEELLIKEVPPYTADGEWIIDHDPEKWYNNSDVSLEDDPDQDWEYESGYYADREPIKHHVANKLYTAMGCAVQRMPRLRLLDFCFRAEVGEGGPKEVLTFKRDLNTRKAVLEISSHGGLQVAEEVLGAWKINEAGEEMVREMKGWGGGRVEFEKWPPA